MVHGGLLLSTSLLVCVVGCAVAAQQQRHLLLRPLPGDSLDSIGRPKKCSNTVHGRLFLADNQGYVCTRDQMDYSTGCCKSGNKQYSCDRCTLADQCCTEYEDCVSCCLHPQHGADKLYSTTLRAPKLPSAGTWRSPWEYCLGVCRTHGHSTMHENAYISTRHHCFSVLRRPMLSDPLPAGALEGVQLLVSKPGQSCDEACRQQSTSCSPQHLQLVNSCDRLREHVPCEAGCEASKLPGGSSPAYMESSTPKPNSPTMCFTMPAADLAALSCAAKDQNAARLCPCKAGQ